MTNPILDQVKNDYTSKLNPKLLPAINKTVDAGKDLMYDKSTVHMTMKAMEQTDPDKLGQSFGGVAWFVHSNNPKIPPEVIIPAGTLIMLAGLQFMEDAGAIKVDKPFLATAQKSLGGALMQLFGATPDKIQQLRDRNKTGDVETPPQAPPSAGILAGAPQGVA